MKNDDNNYEKEEILIENKPNENLLPNSNDTNKIFQQKEKFTQKNYNNFNYYNDNIIRNWNSFIIFSSRSF